MIVNDPPGIIICHLGMPVAATRRGGESLGQACPKLSAFQMHQRPMLRRSMYLFLAESSLARSAQPTQPSCTLLLCRQHSQCPPLRRFPPPSCAFCVCAQGEICMHKTSWWKLARKSPGGSLETSPLPFVASLDQ